MDKQALNGTFVPEGWTLRLAAAIADSLREFAPRIGIEPLVMLAMDCHPWHGTLGLAALTAREAAADNLLADPAKMAAWRYFDFARELTSWQPTITLGQQMRSTYEAGNMQAVAEAFLDACATSMTSESVREVLNQDLTCIEGFRVSVAHPDNNREFVKSARGR